VLRDAAVQPKKVFERDAGKLAKSGNQVVGEVTSHLILLISALRVFAADPQFHRHFRLRLSSAFASELGPGDKLTLELGRSHKDSLSQIIFIGLGHIGLDR
jgi:hypothetical protein